MRRARATATVVFAALAVPCGLARAQDAQTIPTGAIPTGELRQDIGISRPYWSAGPTRPFFAAVFESGGVALRTELDAGWGKPHYAWVGGDVSSHLSLRGLTASTGVRGVASFGSVRAGVRYHAAIQQRFLEERGSFTRPTLDVDAGARARYLSLDGEVTFDIPLPIGNIGGLASVHGLLGVDEDFYVFEEGLRVIVDPPFIWRARLSYLAGWEDPPTFRVGGVVDVIGNPGRQAFWIRTGPAIAVSLTHHLEAVGVAALVLQSPDEIGLAGADLGQIGLRYRWATGDLWPEFP